MVQTSKTGLLSSVQRNTPKKPQETKPLEFKNIAVPAPFVLRPFAGIYNPFPYGCSILCNHPADCEAKDVVKRAKESWQQASDGRAAMSDGGRGTEDGDDLVPEELFRRYTETDSRPITPTPTLASVMTRMPQGRRCVTPDPPGPAQERTLLVLDLRRSHSQETLSCHLTGLPTTILHPPTRSPTPSSGTGTTTRRQPKPRNRLSPDHLARPEDAAAKPAMMSLPPPVVTEPEEQPRRRGRLRKKGKKSGRDLSAGIEREVKGFPEPGETQVSAFGIDSRLGSARPSLTLQGGEGGGATPLEPSGRPSPEPSYLDQDILRLLRRELDQEVIDSEFDQKRRVALQEAMRTFPPDQKATLNEEMVRLQKELRLPPENTELWLSLPRTFSRQSARFELPLDRRQLNTMTPLEYVQKHISITSNRRLLYNRVFNRHKREVDMEDPEYQENLNLERAISGQKMREALGEMMGRPMTDEEDAWFQQLVGWKEDDWLDFRTWCGICALCERIMGPKFCSQLPTREEDPPNGVEQADFDSLSRRLESLNPDPRLKTILISVKTL